MNLLDTLKISVRLYFKTLWVHFLAGGILLIAIGVLYWWLAPVIFGMPMEAIAMLPQEPEKMEALVLSRGFAIKFLLFILLIDGIITPFSAGLYRNFAAVTKGERVTLGNVFAYYRSVETGSILSYVFFLMAVKMVVAVVLGSFPALSMATLVILSIVFSFTLPIIIFEGLPMLRAMGESYKRIVPSIFTAMIAIVTAFGLNLIGLITFGIGIVVTFPIVFVVIFALYYQQQVRGGKR